MKRINWYPELDSTNNEIKRKLRELDNLAVIATESQTAGRGQGTHTWYSTPGLNLTFSILYRPKSLAASDAIVLTWITTASLLRYLASRGVSGRVKWPNDIWVADKKICGLLIENTLDGGRVDSSIIGIGLNIGERNWPEWIPNPVSLTEITGKNYDIHEELDAFMDEFTQCTELSETAEGRMQLKKEFELTLFRLSEERR